MMTPADTSAAPNAAGDTDPARRHLEPARSSLLRTWLPSLLLIALVFGFYATTTANPFASDDYLLVDIASKGLVSATSYHGGYHYIPAGMALLALEHAAWGTSPAGYHWTSIALLALTGLLVVALGRALGFGELASWAAAALLTSNGLIHEIPLWACTVLHSASTCLYVCALLAFLRHLRRGGARYGAGAVALYAVALLTHEQALSLPFAAVMLLIAERSQASSEEWQARWPRAKAPLAALFVTGAAWVVLKLALSDGTAQAPGLATSLVSRAGATLMHVMRLLVPDLSWATAFQLLDPPLHGVTRQLVRLAVVAAGAAIFVLLPRIGKLLSLWVAAHVTIMVFAIGLSSRHYLLPLVPASLVAGLVIERIAGRLGGAPAEPQGGWRTALLAVAFVTPIVVIGVATASVRKLVWAEAGIVAERLLDDTTAAIGARPGATALYVVDLPDGLDLGESEPAYIFRFGFETAMKWRLPEQTFGIIRLRSENPPVRTEPFGAATTARELAALAANPDNLVMRYDSHRRRLIRQGP